MYAIEQGKTGKEEVEEDTAEDADGEEGDESGTDTAPEKPCGECLYISCTEVVGTGR